MAQTDSNGSPTLPFHPAARPALPIEALDRLALLHAEQAENSAWGRFLASAVDAAGVLTLMGVAAISLAAGASLKSCFGWAFLLLIAIAALLRSYIRSTAAVFDRTPMAEAARHMRAILLYGGFAWGAGAVLLLSPMTGPLTGLGFAVLPSLALALILKDRDGVLAFLLPVTAITLAAAVLAPWPDAGVDTALLLMLQSSIGAWVVCSTPRANLPAGLSLR